MFVSRQVVFDVGLNGSAPCTCDTYDTVISAPPARTAPPPGAANRSRPLAQTAQATPAGPNLNLTTLL